MEEQRKALLQNPTLLLSRRASSTSLDDYLDNPYLDYESYSGALLTQQVASAATNIAKEARDSEEGRRKLRQILPYQYEMVQQRGFSREAVMEAIMNSPNANKVLTGLVEDAIGTSGVKKWGDNTTIERAYDYARQGLFNAIGETNYQMITDQAGLIQLQHSLQARAAREAEERARLKMYDVSPSNYYSKTEIAAANELTVKELDRWKKLGYFNSKGQLTKSGFKALQYKPAKSGTFRFDRFGREIPTRVKGGSGNFEFYNWALKHGVTNPSDRYSVNILNDYYQNTRSAIASGKLATGAANFQVYRQRLYNDSDRKVMVDNITNVLGDKGKIYRAGRLSNNTISESRNDAITGEKFKEITKDNPILYVVNSPTTGKYGQQLIELANGDKYILPTGILGNDAQKTISDANTKVRNAGSRGEVAVNLNRANAALASMYTITTGTEIKPNDGTSIIELE